MMTITANLLKSFKQKSFGLIEFDTPKPIFFKTRFGIHTFFMKFNIDVLILNNEMKVVKIKKNLHPNNIFVWNPKYENVLELPSATINSLKIRLGQKLDIKFL